MNEYNGRVAFWRRYEKSNILQKRNLLTPVATKIMKDMVVPSKSIDHWKSKLSILLDHMIKGYDILIDIKNEEIFKNEKRNNNF